ncbi:hypothetical protein RFI_33181 [Reticulomyxa filosa]|uniref:Uncharacterized protein n=1 Tax=Reticulomyxa filosa TaxID=46433 RepID=X6LQQ5_RETFI|nr:hypothetical protein RFI_33181 [Reticulomyxa filosa]|eukprot:ETO04218.1 hypothetical protein RFI_33181 [Reticulomyxa filosa]
MQCIDQGNITSLQDNKRLGAQQVAKKSKKKYTYPIKIVKKLSGNEDEWTNIQVIIVLPSTSDISIVGNCNTLSLYECDTFFIMRLKCIQSSDFFTFNFCVCIEKWNKTTFLLDSNQCSFVCALVS